MRIELDGYDIDNLLKLLYLKRITLTNIARNDHKKVSFEILDKDYHKVKRYIKNFKLNVKYNIFRRLPKIIVSNIGLLLAIFFGSIFGIFVSNYTWQIKIYGLEEIGESEIVDVLKNNGISVGKINLQSSEDIETILFNNYDRIAQVSVIKRGTAIVINLSEKLVYVETEYAPLSAKRNGIVSSISLMAGTLNVKIGDYVNAGDALVLPFILDAQGNKISVEPRAEIKGNMFILGVCELNKNDTALVRTGNIITEYHYKFRGWNLFSGKAKNSFALFETSSYNEYISDLLPLNRTVITYYELELSDIVHDFESEKAGLILKSRELAHNNLVSFEYLIDEISSVIIVGDRMIATTTITIAGIIHD